MEAQASVSTVFKPSETELQKALHFLNEEDRALLKPFLTGAEYPAETMLTNEGEMGEWMAFVVAGKLAVKKETNFSGKSILFAILEEGSMVGEISGLEKGKRMASVEVVEKCRLLQLSRDNFEILLQEHPYLGIKILKRIVHVVAMRVKKADDRLVKLL